MHNLNIYKSKSNKYYRSVRSEGDNEVPTMTDYGRGDMVGLEEVLLKSDRRSRVLAVRDSDSKLSVLFMSGL
jgi:hypothetical protein